MPIGIDPNENPYIAYAPTGPAGPGKGPQGTPTPVGTGQQNPTTPAGHQAAFDEFAWTMQRLQQLGIPGYSSANLPNRIWSLINKGYKSGHIVGLYNDYMQSHGGTPEAAFGQSHGGPELEGYLGSLVAGRPNRSGWTPSNSALLVGPTNMGMAGQLGNFDPQAYQQWQASNLGYQGTDNPGGAGAGNAPTQPVGGTAGGGVGGGVGGAIGGGGGTAGGGTGGGVGGAIGGGGGTVGGSLPGGTGTPTTPTPVAPSSPGGVGGAIGGAGGGGGNSFFPSGEFGGSQGGYQPPWWMPNGQGGQWGVPYAGMGGGYNNPWGWGGGAVNFTPFINSFMNSAPAGYTMNQPTLPGGQPMPPIWQYGQTGWQPFQYQPNYNGMLGGHQNGGVRQPPQMGGGQYGQTNWGQIPVSPGFGSGQWGQNTPPQMGGWMGPVDQKPKLPPWAYSPAHLPPGGESRGIPGLTGAGDAAASLQSSSKASTSEMNLPAKKQQYPGVASPTSLGNAISFPPSRELPPQAGSPAHMAPGELDNEGRKKPKPAGAGMGIPGL